MIYLLDTNVCIEVIRSRSQPVVDRIRSHPVGQIAIGTVTVAELEHGVAKSSHQTKNKVALLQFLAPFEILPFDQAAAQKYGIIRHDLESRGERIGPMDLLIAAQALAADLTLVTNNVSEFTRVRGLRVEDWTQGLARDGA
jgi:tRNA(fMet)-specific endonuclease VapC